MEVPVLAGSPFNCLPFFFPETGGGNSTEIAGKHYISIWLHNLQSLVQSENAEPSFKEQEEAP